LLRQWFSISPQTRAGEGVFPREVCWQYVASGTDS